MDILSHQHYQEFLAYLPRLKSAPKEWRIIKVKLLDGSAAQIEIGEIAGIIHVLFHDKEGKIYISHENEILLVVRAESDTDPQAFSARIEKALPDGSCQVYVQNANEADLSKFELLIRVGKSKTSCAEQRKGRRENIILIADDDMYMRLLVKRGLAPPYTVHEVKRGDELIEAYRTHAPDVLFLDIHMPGKSGIDNLQDILTLDPRAYVVMLSADSSVENVEWTVRHGAKGFVTKPFTREKLLSYIDKCDTIVK